MLNSRFIAVNNSVRFVQSAPVIESMVGRAVFAGLLLLIAFTAFPLGVVDPWWDPIFESAIFILGIGWVITLMISKRRQLPTILAPVAGLILLAILQIFSTSRQGWGLLTVDAFGTRSFVIKALSVGLALGMLLYYTSSQKRLLAIVHLVVVAGAASAGLGLLLWQAPTTRLASLWYSDFQPESFGQFANRNHFALLMEMSLGPALGLTISAIGRTTLFLYAATALFISGALVLANSRGGIISMLAQFAFFSWTWFGSFQRSSLRWTPYGQSRFWRMTESVARRVFLTIFFLGVACWSVLWLGGEPLRRRLESVPNEFTRRTNEHSGLHRLEIWAATGKLIEDHPLLGSGMGAYQTAVSDYFPPSDHWLPQQAHNEYLELLAGGGIIGAVLGVCFVFIVIREARRRLAESDHLRRSVCLGALVGLVGVAIHSMVDFGLHITVNALVCCVLIAMAATKIRPGSQQNLRTA